MSTVTINAFVAQERNAFENFTAPIASRIEEAWCRSLARAMKDQLADKSRAEISLPWGTYRAELVVKGEAGNINVSWEPSKGFMKVLNGDNMDTAERAECINQDTFDEKFLKDFRDYVAYGFFDPDDKANKDKVGGNKGVRLSEDEAYYFMNEYGLMMTNVARDKQRDGKIFCLEISNGFAHGKFNFEYDDDDIKVTFVADKIFKQILKDDDAAARADSNNFTPISAEEAGRKITIPVDPVTGKPTKELYNKPIVDNRPLT